MAPDIERGRPLVITQESGPDEDAPGSVNLVALTVAPVRRPKPDAAAFSLADLPSHLTTSIAIDPETGEWVWVGRTDRDGYGRYGNKGVHRIVYTALVGPIPAGREIDHVRRWGCTSRACCSPWHLEPVTSRENCMRGASFAAVNAAKIECIHGHPFDLFGTYWRPNGHRDCRACIRDRVKRYRRRKRAAARAAGAPAPAPLTELGRAA